MIFTITDSPPTVTLVYVRLKSVLSNHFVESSTVPAAEGGIPGEDGVLSLGDVD